MVAGKATRQVYDRLARATSLLYVVSSPSLSRSMSSAPLLRAVLVPTWRRHVTFALLGAESFDGLWPGHPPVWVLTDHGPDGHATLVRTARGPERLSWVEVVRRGMDQLLARGALALDDWVLLVIEDHTPAEVVPHARIHEAIAHAEARGAPYVRVHVTNPRADIADGEVASGAPMFRMRRDWTWYHSLHPAAWRVDHLRATLALALVEGATSPWAFERLPARDVEHLACPAPWPSPWGGYLKSGQLDVQVIRRMRHPAVARLRRALLGAWLVQAVRRRLERLVTRSRARGD